MCEKTLFISCIPLANLETGKLNVYRDVPIKIRRCLNASSVEVFYVSNETITKDSHANKEIMGYRCFFTYRIYLVEGRDEYHYNLEVLPK